MPIIAIFTKYDRLVDEITIYDNPRDSSEKKAKAEAKLEELCIKPFEDHIGQTTQIPHIAISSECDI